MRNVSARFSRVIDVFMTTLTYEGSQAALSTDLLVGSIASDPSW